MTMRSFPRANRLLALAATVAILPVFLEAATPTPTRTLVPTRTLAPTITPTPTRTPTITPSPTWPVACRTAVAGGEQIAVDVRYAHEVAPGVLYVRKLGPIDTGVGGVAEIHAEGAPVGCVWRYVIFADGFECGTTAAWSEP